MEYQACRSGDTLFMSGLEWEVLKRLASSFRESKRQAEILFLSDPLRLVIFMLYS